MILYAIWVEALPLCTRTWIQALIMASDAPPQSFHQTDVPDNKVRWLFYILNGLVMANPCDCHSS